MDEKVKSALRDFFTAQRKLHEFGVIGSKHYIDDIGVYLCSMIYGMEPVGKKGKSSGYEGLIGTSRIAVRLTNCPTGTPVRIAAPISFDELIVVLGPNSWMRPEGIKADFITYRLSKEEVLDKFRESNGIYSGDAEILPVQPDKLLSLE
jgi:hypothetical protein